MRTDAMLQTALRKLRVSLAFLFAVAFLRPAIAGPEPLPSQPMKTAALEAKVAEPTWNGDAGVNFVTAYIAFGILQENQGVIAEPYIDVYHTMFQSDGWISKVSLGLQLWSSIHSAETLANRGSSVAAWYEFDYYVPLAITIAKRTTVTISYLEYDFPNGAFTPQRGVQANVAYDDTDLLGAFALHPHILALCNFDGILGVGKSRAWYGEIGIAPGFTVAKKGTYPISFTFPVLLGIGDAHFYPGDVYGYFSATGNVSVPLAFLPKSFGAWTANAGFTYYNLGNATTEINANRDRNAYVGQIGVGLTF
jgi:hypothetical protein